MRNKLIFILIVLFLVSGIYYYFSFDNSDGKIVCIGDNCFNVEIADSLEERQRGLMYRGKLDNMSGMLFVFEEVGKYGFWMKNTLIKLDIIWINGDGKIVYIVENALPCDSECVSYVPENDALYVLELDGGSVGKYGIFVGDEVVIR